jgi:hypothetical protein
MPLTVTPAFRKLASGWPGKLGQLHVDRLSRKYAPSIEESGADVTLLMDRDGDQAALIKKEGETTWVFQGAFQTLGGFFKAMAKKANDPKPGLWGQDRPHLPHDRGRLP